MCISKGPTRRKSLYPFKNTSPNDIISHDLAKEIRPSSGTIMSSAKLISSSKKSPPDQKTRTTPDQTDLLKRKKNRSQDLGLTAKNHVRHYDQHNYHDHANDLPADDRNLEDSSLLKKPHASKGKKEDSFPMRVHRLLVDVESDGIEHIVSWQPHGRAFVVHNPSEFVRQVLPKHFRQSKITSFQRQLNIYGFTRLSRGLDKGGYYHEYFIRGKQFLCDNMSRTKVKGTGVRTTSNPDLEPDFYAMKYIVAGQEMEFPTGSHCSNENVLDHCSGTANKISLDGENSSPMIFPSNCKSNDMQIDDDHPQVPIREIEFRRYSSNLTYDLDFSSEDDDNIASIDIDIDQFFDIADHQDTTSLQNNLRYSYSSISSDDENQIPQFKSNQKSNRVQIDDCGLEREIEFNKNPSSLTYDLELNLEENDSIASIDIDFRQVRNIADQYTDVLIDSCYIHEKMFDCSASANMISSDDEKSGPILSSNHKTDGVQMDGDHPKVWNSYDLELSSDDDDSIGSLDIDIRGFNDFSPDELKLLLNSQYGADDNNVGAKDLDDNYVSFLDELCK